MSLSAHLENLHAKHQSLETELSEEMNHPAYNFQKIATIKKEKLRIKEEILALVKDQQRIDKTAS